MILNNFRKQIQTTLTECGGQAQHSQLLDRLTDVVQGVVTETIDRLNGEYEGRPTRRELLNIIKGYDNTLLAKIVAKNGDQLAENNELVKELRKQFNV